MRTVIAGKRTKSLLVTLAGVYLALLACLCLFQERLLFFPQRITDEYAASVTADSNVEEITIETSDSATLHGWLARHPPVDKAPLLIYYGGNGEEVSHLVSQAGRFPGYAVLAMNYRGYGLSGGWPNERNLCRDAELIYDTFANREDIDPERIVVMGRSIGTGVAVHIATCRPVRGIILVTPYDSLVRIVQAKVRAIPASLLLRNRFNSIAVAPQLEMPLLALVAGRDEVIPPVYAYNLTGEWGGEVALVTVEDAGHNDIQNSDLFWESIDAFLKAM